MDIYLRIFSLEKTKCLAPIETVITLFLRKYCDSNVNVKFVLVTEKLSRECAYTLEIPNLHHYKVMREIDVPSPANSCDFPNVVETDGSCIAGLCATLRKIVKQRLLEEQTHHCQNLLGFKNSCLLACSEASVWTKFCEVEIVSVLRSSHEYGTIANLELPTPIARFERHMAEPVKLHNINKYSKSKKFTDIIDIGENGLPEHHFAEGPSLTLSDVIIFTCYYALLNVHLNEAIFQVLPLTAKWYTRMLDNDGILRSIQDLSLEGKNNSRLCLTYTLPEVDNFSLYKSDPKR